MQQYEVSNPVEAFKLGSLLEEFVRIENTLFCFLGVWCRYRYEYEAAFLGAEQNP